MNEITFVIPWPPTVNTYWRRVGAKTLISKKGRKFRSEVQAMLIDYNRKPLLGRLSVRIEAYPPDYRRRDLDNLLKSTLDAITHAGIWADDEQIDKLTISRETRFDGGMLGVYVHEIH